jgi:hypothetical protein
VNIRRNTKLGSFVVLRSVTLLLFALLLLASGVSDGAQATVPDPDDYPAGPVFRGKPAPPSIGSRLSKLFRTKIREGAKEGPNFAGHFTLVAWGCGMDSYMFVVVDAKSGRIYEPPVGCMTLAGGFGLPIPGIEENSNPGYRLDSKLLLIIGVEDDENASSDGREARIFLFDRGKFETLYRAPAPLD